MSGPTGMTAGVITVAGDGTYTATPTLGPFNVPATATSLAQARFEARVFGATIGGTAYPGILASMTPEVQAQVVNTTTSPPTTNKGKVMQGIAADVNLTAWADIGYFQANAVATVSTSASVGEMPSSTTAGTPIAPPGAPVLLPVT